MDDKLLQLAFSIYHKPRVYALLLGSGVSASSGIPSGWAIMKDLIRKIALVRNEQIEGEPYDWYTAQYNEPPSYDRLLAKLGARPLDRSALLRPYFEPTPEEQKQERKLPTKAHKSIAKLVKDGYIQIVLTINFDRLLEKAFEAEGIIPIVVSTTEMIEGIAPPQHSQITIVKLHGDYLDGRIKNTPEELAEYDKSINKLLDRILDEWGLIVCGWSAEWDKALRDAIDRAQGRRYTTYWAAYGDLKEDAQRLVVRRQAEVIQIAGADDFFYQVEQAVLALQSSNHRHPLSVRVAVEQVKKLLSDSQGQIDLEELFDQEIAKAHDIFTSEEFFSRLNSAVPEGLNSSKALAKYLDLYFEVCELALHITATLCWHGDGKLSQNLANAIARWAEYPEQRIFASLAYIPALLMVYVAGIAAVRREKWSYLQAVVADPVMPMQYAENNPSWMDILSEKVLAAHQKSVLTLPAPLSRILHSRLHTVFQGLPLSQTFYSNTFDLFEVVLCTAYLAKPNPKFNPEWIPYHLPCFVDRSWNYIKSFWLRGGRQVQNWDLLQVEPFSGDVSELAKTLALYVSLARKVQKDENEDDVGEVPDYAKIYKEASGSVNWEAVVI